MGTMDPKKSPSPISAAGLLGPDLVTQSKGENYGKLYSECGRQLFFLRRDNFP